ncbi:hypothetical protein VP01_3090g2, partial [Puccinia sorghi]
MRRCDRKGNCASKHSELDEKTRITSISATVSKRFSPNNILKPDGSNLHQLGTDVSPPHLRMLQHPEFFTEEEDQHVEPQRGSGPARVQHPEEIWQAKSKPTGAKVRLRDYPG